MTPWPGRRGLGHPLAVQWADPEALPTVRSQGLSGGQYWDAQFDDTRLAVTLARTAIAGAL